MCRGRRYSQPHTLLCSTLAGVWSEEAGTLQNTHIHHQSLWWYK